MPLINDSPDPHRRARELTKQRSRAQEERIRQQLNNNVPVPARALKIVTQESQTPRNLTPEIIAERNLRRINREARMKANNERRANIIRQPSRALPTRPSRRPPVNNPPVVPVIPPIVNNPNNNKPNNPPVVPLIPPLVDNKNYDFITQPDYSKRDELNSIDNAIVPNKDNKNLYLIGGVALVVLLIATKKR